MSTDDGQARVLVTEAQVAAAVSARDQYVSDESESAWDNRVAETRAALEAAMRVGGFW